MILPVTSRLISITPSHPCGVSIARRRPASVTRQNLVRLAKKMNRRHPHSFYPPFGRANRPKIKVDQGRSSQISRAERDRQPQAARRVKPGRLNQRKHHRVLHSEGLLFKEGPASCHPWFPHDGGNMPPLGSSLENLTRHSLNASLPHPTCFPFPADFSRQAFHRSRKLSSFGRFYSFAHSRISNWF
jgi:hypothetical protein